MSGEIVLLVVGLVVGGVLVVWSIVMAYILFVKRQVVECKMCGGTETAVCTPCLDKMLEKTKEAFQQ